MAKKKVPPPPSSSPPKGKATRKKTAKKSPTKKKRKRTPEKSHAPRKKREIDRADPVGEEVFLGCTDRQRIFLKVLSVTGQLSSAQDITGTGKWSHHNWLRSDENYRVLYKEAMRMAADRLESEAIRRAKDGVKRLKFYKGQLIMVPVRDENNNIVYRTDEDGNKEVVMEPYCEYEYSDMLMNTLLKGFFPKRYRERQDIKVHNTSDVRVAGLAPQELVDDAKRKLEGIYNRLKKSDSTSIISGNGNGNGKH